MKSYAREVWVHAKKSGNSHESLNAAVVELRRVTHHPMIEQELLDTFREW